MLIVTEQRGWGLASLTLWSAAIFVGLFAFFFLSQPLALTDNGPWLGAFWSIGGLICGSIAGAIIGLIQRAVLPGRVPWTKHWVLATVVGWAIGGGLYWFLMSRLIFDHSFQGLDSNVNALLEVGTTACAGLCTGVGQSLCLHPMRYRLWWISATGVSWMLSGIAFAVLLTMFSFSLGLLLLLLSLIGCIVGVVTRVAMQGLIARAALNVQR